MVICTSNNIFIDTERFNYALSLYQKQKNQPFYDPSSCPPKTASIGTLGEKSLHAVLKFYYEPDAERHEQPVGAHIADIVSEEGIIEIQTRNLAALRPKLHALLGLCRVTVVHPILLAKRVISIDGATGEVLSVRKSPRHGTIYTEMREIYSLRDFLTDRNFRLKLPLLTADEYRTFGVRTRRRKKQRTKRGEYVSDTLPTGLIDEITLSEPADWAILLPEGLPSAFTTREFAAASGADIPSSRMAINLLIRAGQLDPAAHVRSHTPSKYRRQQ